MAERRQTVFLERQTYRRRRLIDWISILPLLGLALWSVPLLWSDEGTISTASAMIFIFGVWLALVVIAAVSARALRGIDELEEDAEEPRGDP